MASPFARLRAFAQTRNGRIALGGTAATAAVGAGLYSRHRHGGDAAPPAADGASSSSTSPLPSVLQATGTSGANTGGAVDPVSSGPDTGQFEQLLQQQADQNDLLQQLLDNQAPPAPTGPTQGPVPTAPPPAPPPAAPPVVIAPAPPPAAAPRTYTVVKGDNLSTIAQRFYGKQTWQKIYNANVGVIGSNPNLIKPGQVLVIPP